MHTLKSPIGFIKKVGTVKKTDELRNMVHCKLNVNVYKNLNVRIVGI